jgi:hypothetical protein
LARKSRLGDGRHIGQSGGPLSAQDGEPAQLAFLDVRHGRREHDEAERSVATEY